MAQKRWSKRSSLLKKFENDDFLPLFRPWWLQKYNPSIWEKKIPVCYPSTRYFLARCGL
jgi:hypothetical protein